MNTNVDEKSLTAQNPQSLISLALEKGTPMDQLEKLLELKERWDAAQANKSFLAALSNFQKEVPAIQKKKQVSFAGRTGGNVNYKYAELGEIDETIKEAMANNGLSKRWEITEDGEKIICTCIISHIDGHKEITTMSSLKDASGNKNEIQSRASAVTYLQRYTLIGALGLTTASEDNDGDGTPPARQSTQQQNNDLPWLNIRDKQGKLLPDGEAVKKNIAAGIETLETLSERYKLSKAVRDELALVKVTGSNDEYIDHEPVIPAAPPITAPDKKPFVIPGLWYAKIEKCKIIEDVKALFDKNKETIEGTYELQKLFMETYMGVCKSKAEVLAVYNAHKDIIIKSAELQGILKTKRNSFSQPVTQ